MQIQDMVNYFELTPGTIVSVTSLARIRHPAATLLIETPQLSTSLQSSNYAIPQIFVVVVQGIMMPVVSRLDLHHLKLRSGAAAPSLSDRKHP